MAAKRKVYPQVLAIEALLVAACATGAWFLARHFISPAWAGFLAGAACAKALDMLLRHRNKPLLPKGTLHKLTTRPAGRR